MVIKLRDYQRKAVEFVNAVNYALLCMRVGSGKTICAMFALRSFFKNKKIDKAIIACTKSSVNVFKGDFKEKAGMNVRLVETTEALISFLQNSTEKVCLVKHSMFEKAGNDVLTIRALDKISQDGLRVALVIDEAHKMQNPDGIAHEAFEHIKFLFNRIILLTATPYSSCLSQFYGLIHLIYPKLWKSKREFFNRYIDEVTILSPITHRVVRKEKVRYKNLKEFRQLIEPFTYFYYPSIPLVHVEHHCQLLKEHMEEYNDLCKGILSEEDLKKINK